MSKKSEIDDAGVTPGLVQPVGEPAAKEVSMRCAEHEKCNSTKARVLQDNNDGRPSSYRMYQCVKCMTAWGVAVGGDIGI